MEVDIVIPWHCLKKKRRKEGRAGQAQADTVEAKESNLLDDYGDG
jgi:hypothetical protein